MLSNKVDIVLDYGQNIVTVYHVNEDRCETVTADKLPELVFSFPENSVIVSEAAHLAVPRTRKSKAQILPEEKLLLFYTNVEVNNCTLRFCPQDLAPRVRQVARSAGIITGDSKDKATDEDDCKAIAYFYNNNDKLRSSLQKPSKSFDKNHRRLAGEEIKSLINEHLNFWRSADDSSEQNTMLKKLIEENKEFLYDSVSPESREILRLERNKKGTVTKTSLNKGMTLIYTMGCTVYDLEGEVICRYENKIPGWNFIKRFVLCSSPNHRKGGVARSNIWYHAFKNYVMRSTGTGSIKMKNYVPNDPDIDFTRTFVMEIKGDEKQVRIKRGHFNAKEDAKFLELRGKFNKCLQELHTFFCTLAIKNGKGKYELLGDNRKLFTSPQTKLFD